MKPDKQHKVFSYIDIQLIVPENHHWSISLKKRNEILKENVPGARPGSYMSTETKIPLPHPDRSHRKQSGMLGYGRPFGKVEKRLLWVVLSSVLLG